MQAFWRHFAITVSESFANFWKSSRLHEKLTKSAPGPRSACVWAATSRARGVVRCPQLLPSSRPQAAPWGGTRAPDPGSFCVRSRQETRAARPAYLRRRSQRAREAQPRLHEPGSGAGAPRRRTGACGSQGRSGRAQRASPPTAGLPRRAAGSPRPRLRPGVGCDRHKLQSALPIPAQGCRLWVRAFWLPHHPLSPPRPRRRWVQRGGLWTRAHGVASPEALGNQLVASRSTQHGEGWGAAPRGRVRWVGWGGGRDSCRKATRAHTHMHTHAPRAHSICTPTSLLPARCPGTCSSHPSTVGEIKRLHGSLSFISEFREGSICQRSPNDTLPLHRPACQGPGRTCTRDSRAPAASPSLSQELTAGQVWAAIKSKEISQVGLAVLGCPSSLKSPLCGEVGSSERQVPLQHFKVVFWASRIGHSPQAP